MEQDPSVDEQTRAAGAEAGAIGGRAPESLDPARVPVDQAGGGEAEGFEQAEQDLIEAAEQGGRDPGKDAFTPEKESDLASGAVYGEADMERSSERQDEQE